MFELQPNERIVLDNGNLGFRRKLMLTNQRLIIIVGKGLFNVTWSKESEIPLTEIEEVHSEIGAINALDFLKIKKKNGEIIDLFFKLSDGQIIGAGIQEDTLAGMAIRQNNISTKWIIAINQQLSK
jgi:hypothetical protein